MRILTAAPFVWAAMILPAGPATAAPTFTERVVDPSLFAATGVIATDIDADGDTDILVTALNQPGVVWYENDGASPPGFTRRLITINAAGARALAATDLDGDGDLDLLVSERFPERLVWLQQFKGAAGPAFTERQVWAGADGARHICVIDFDHDGDTDVVAAGQFGESTAAWIENIHGPGGVPSFVVHVIPCSENRDLSSAAGDIDGDGDTDVVLMRNETFGDGWIGCMENVGPAAPGAPPLFVERQIDARVGGEHNATILDFDGDGDADVLCASFNGDQVSSFENTSGPGAAPRFTRRVIALPARGASEAWSADFDGDGDLDVLAAMYHDGEVRWFERTPGGWVSHLLRGGAINAEHVAAADIDGDGDTDAVAALFDSVTWYENAGVSCPGDANGDLIVNFADLNIVLSAFGQTGAAGTIPADLNGDGVVNFADLNEVLSFFGAAC